MTTLSTMCRTVDESGMIEPSFSNPPRVFDLPIRNEPVRVDVIVNDSAIVDSRPDIIEGDDVTVKVHLFGDFAEKDAVYMHVMGNDEIMTYKVSDLSSVDIPKRMLMHGIVPLKFVGYSKVNGLTDVIQYDMDPKTSSNPDGYVEASTDSNPIEIGSWYDR